MPQQPRPQRSRARSALRGTSLAMAGLGALGGTAAANPQTKPPAVEIKVPARWHIIPADGYKASDKNKHALYGSVSVALINYPVRNAQHKIVAYQRRLAIHMETETRGNNVDKTLAPTYQAEMILRSWDTTHVPYDDLLAPKSKADKKYWPSTWDQPSITNTWVLPAGLPAGKWYVEARWTGDFSIKTQVIDVPPTGQFYLTSFSPDDSQTPIVHTVSAQHSSSNSTHAGLTL